MKKLFLFAVTIVTMLFVLSCSNPGSNNNPSNNSDSENGKPTVPDLTTINGVYEYTEVINNQTYKATITIFDYDDYKLINDKDYANDSIWETGKIKTVESPKRYFAMPYSDSELEEIIRTQYEEEKKDPKSDYYQSTFEKYNQDIREYMKGADGTPYEFYVILKGHGYSTDNYDAEDIFQLAGLDPTNTISLNVSKRMFGENLYFMERDDFSKLYCFTLAEKLFSFTKIK